MPQSRKSQVSLIDTPFYHCVSRCVRRCFLCGIDRYSGQNFEHRRGWVENRLLFLASVFAIDICAYAVMSNHVHVVLHVDKSKAKAWTLDDVLHQYHKLHKGTLLTQKYVRGEILTPGEQITLNETIEQYRSRLYNISWLMRVLNEYIARKANKEDDCTGRFWEGRFKSQALLDESAVLACMAYVDLNPVRAKIANTPDTSAHTSIIKRIKAANKNNSQPKILMPFVGDSKKNATKGIAYSFQDYCELIDITGQCIQEEKADNIEHSQNHILKQIGLSAVQWIKLTTEFERHFYYAAGSVKSMGRFKTNTKHQRLRGMSSAKALLQSA